MKNDELSRFWRFSPSPGSLRRQNDANPKFCEGQLLTRVVPWPVVMADGGVAPDAAAALASPPAAAVLAPYAPSPPPSLLPLPPSMPDEIERRTVDYWDDRRAAAVGIDVDQYICERLCAYLHSLPTDSPDRLSLLVAVAPTRSTDRSSGMVRNTSHRLQLRNGRDRSGAPLDEQWTQAMEIRAAYDAEHEQ